MERFYKITKAEASQIGYFEYAANQAIDPFAGEQKDGSCIISEDMYRILKDNERLRVVDFSKKPIIDAPNLDPKAV